MFYLVYLYFSAFNILKIKFLTEFCFDSDVQAALVICGLFLLAKLVQNDHIRVKISMFSNLSFYFPENLR